MAIGDSYATPAELELRLKRPDDGQFGPILAAVSRDIERYCARQFNKTATATARTYHPTNRWLVKVDDFHTTTDLVVKTDEGDDGTYEVTWASSDYLLEPRDGLRDGVPGWPYEHILAIGSVRTFPCWGVRPSVQVTAQWGWASVPAAVKEAAKAGAEMMVGKDPSPVVGESIDGYSVTYARTGSDSPYYGLARYRRVVPGLLVA